jgi:hypothetical protein
MRFRILLLAATLLVALPATVRAAPFDASLNRAYKVAETYWEGGPLGCSTLDQQIVPEDNLEGDPWAVATETRPTAEPEPCVNYVSRRLARPRWFYTACAVEIHELGHLRGFGHSDDPASPMYAGNVLYIPGICIREAPPQAKF